MKKIALLSFGIADGYCNPASNRVVTNGPQLYRKVLEHLAASNNQVGAYVAINNPADTSNIVNVDKNLQPTKIINLKLCTDQFLHVNNELSLTDYEGDTMLFNGNQLDFIIRPKDFDIHICGIDINGVFIDAIDSLLDLGYYVTVYSDMIKPFSKKTIMHIKHRNIKFVSAKSVCLK